MEHSKIAALVELGILCRGEPVEVCGDGASDPGPHTYSGHNQMCRYIPPYYQHPFDEPTVEAYSLFSPETTVYDAMSKTRLVVFLGLADSVELRESIASPDTIILIFEPDERALVNCLRAMRLADLNRKNLFCFTGDPHSFNPALQDLLPGDMFRQGTPAFFMTERVRSVYSEWASRVIEYLELLYFRHVLYGMTGQAMAKSRPFRDIHRGLMFDQQLHAYKNIGDYFKFQSVAELRNRFSGMSAILVAAGPSLADKLDYIRRNKSHAVVICVNNALKSLVEAGIHPHFVVINDTSIASGAVFKHVHRMPDTILVGHCLSDLGGDVFQQKYLFGSFLPELYGHRMMLKLHGSVISTAFAFARLIGCVKCVMVGTQLASDNPWGMRYVKGTVEKDVEEGDGPLGNEYPSLYPTTSASGKLLFTTLNFLDSARWLAEEIRLSGVECINTSSDSILYGKGISFEDEPRLPKANVQEIHASLFKTPPPRVDRRAVLQYLRQDSSFWKFVRDTARTLLTEEGATFVAKGMAILGHFDQRNVTYLVQRYGDFNNSTFHQNVFERDEALRQVGLRDYYEHVHAMSEELLLQIKRSIKAV